jgi:hypothetical protein
MRQGGSSDARLRHLADRAGAGSWWPWSPDQCIGRSPIDGKRTVGFADHTGYEMKTGASEVISQHALARTLTHGGVAAQNRAE